MVRFIAEVLLLGLVLSVYFIDFDKLQSSLGYGSGYSLDTQIPDARLFYANGTLVNKEDFAGKNVFIFFGFLSCGTTCPATLNKLQQLDIELKKDGNRLIFLYINLEPLNDLHASELTRAFSRFPDNFVPVYAESVNEIRKVTSALHTKADFLNFSPEDHTAHIYLADKSFRVKKIYINKKMTFAELYRDYNRLEK